MKKKFFASTFVGMVSATLLFGCGSIDPVSIDPVSQKVIDDINSIGTVELSDEDLITKTLDTYSTLTEEQKNQVSNYAVLLSAKDELDQLIAENNKPIALTKDNYAEYLNVNVYTHDITETSVSGFLGTEYDYTYVVTGEASPFKTGYYDNVTITVSWSQYNGASAVYDIKLDDTGNGTYSYTQRYDNAAMRKDFQQMEIYGFEVTSITGSYYKVNPN